MKQCFQLFRIVLKAVSAKFVRLFLRDAQKIGGSFNIYFVGILSLPCGGGKEEEEI